MAAFTKDVLYPGRYQLADGRWVEYTPDDSAHLAKRMKDMLAAGLSVPMAWEHQEIAPAGKAQLSAWLEKRERGTCGWAEDATVDGEGILGFKVEVPVAEDAKRMPAIRFVSPEIAEDYRDGTGKVWPGKSITHIAVTSRPVQPGQRPFQRLSQGQGGENGKRVRLSLGDFTMADESDKPEGGKKPPEKPAEGGGELGPLIAALKAHGFIIPDSVADMAGLLIAIESNENDSVMRDEDGDGEVDEAIVEGAPPVMLSLHKRVVDGERAGIEARIKALKNKVGKPLVDELLGKLGTVRLSLDSQGKLKGNRLLAQVEAYERLGGGFVAGGKPSRLSLASEAAKEAEDTRDRREKAPETREETEAALAEWDAMMGRAKK